MQIWLRGIISLAKVVKAVIWKDTVMPPKPQRKLGQKLTEAQIEALLEDSDSDDDDLDEIFGPGIDLEDTEQDLAQTEVPQDLPSGSGEARTENEDEKFDANLDNYDNDVESKYSILFFVIHKKQIQFTLKIVHLSVGKFTCQNIMLTN